MARTKYAGGERVRVLFDTLSRTPRGTTGTVTKAPDPYVPHVQWDNGETSIIPTTYIEKVQ